MNWRNALINNWEFRNSARNYGVFLEDCGENIVNEHTAILKSYKEDLFKIPGITPIIELHFSEEEWVKLQTGIKEEQKLNGFKF